MAAFLNLLSQRLCITLLVICFVISYTNLSMAQDEQCSIKLVQQITNSPEETSLGSPDISDDGTRIVFFSDVNINNQNEDRNRQAFYYDTRTGVLTQVTLEREGSVRDTRISGDGNIITFAYTVQNDLNPDGNTEVFKYNIETKVLTNIVNQTDGFSRSPSINYDGSQIAFVSNSPILGGGILPQVQIFLYDQGSGISQITNETAPMRDPDLSAKADTITFSSQADLTGDNPDNAVVIFSYDISSDTFKQIIDPVGANNRFPTVSADGSIITLTSDADLFTGVIDIGRQIYYFDNNLNVLNRLTNEIGFDSTNSVISADGNRIAFRSSSNITGENPENNPELLLFDMKTGQFEQMTDTQSAEVISPAISGDGSYIAFDALGNITGDNPDLSREIYLATCLKSRSVPTLSEWGLIATAGLLGFMSLMVLTRRKAAV